MSDQSPNPFKTHERVTEVADVVSASFQAIYVVTTGTLITYNEDGTTTDWGEPAAGAFIPGPHYGVDDASTAVVNGYKN